MGVRRTDNGWMAQVQVGGRRRTKRCTTKREAEDWMAAERRRLESDPLGMSDKTVMDAIDRYAREVTPGKKSARWEGNTLARLKADTIAGCRLVDLSPSDVAGWRDRRLRSVSGSTCNREFNVLSAVLAIARKEWGWLDRSVTATVRRPQENRPRQRIPSDEEIERILEQLGADVATVSGRVGLAYRFALETALRVGEIAKLRPMDRRGRSVVVRDPKNGTDRVVPLSPAAITICDAVGCDFHLTSSQITSMFARARKMAMVDGTTFHDSRRAAATRLAKRFSVLELSRITGHKDLRILSEVYYSPDAEELADKLA